MWDRIICVNPQMTKSVIKKVLLCLKMCYDVSVKLCFQLETHSFNVNYVVAYLQLRGLYGFNCVFFGSFFPWFRYEVFEKEEWLRAGGPAGSTLVGTWKNCFSKVNFFKVRHTIIDYYGDAVVTKSWGVGVDNVWYTL